MLTGDQRVLLQVAGQHQAEEDGEAQHKEVPGGVEVHELQVGQAHGGDHPEQGAEQRPQDRVGQRGEERTEFTHKPQQQHHSGAVLDHASAANLEDQREARLEAVVIRTFFNSKENGACFLSEYGSSW